MNQESEYHEDPRPIGAEPPIPFIREVQRKVFHFATLVIPVGYYVTDRSTALITIGILLAAAIAAEYARLNHATFARFFGRWFGGMLRKHESSGLSAATFLLISSFLVIMAFHRDIAVLTLLYLIVGDGLAAIVGRRYGRRPVLGKTIEGSLAFAVSGVFVALLFPLIPWWIRLAGVFTATISELLPMRASDNLRVPIISGSVMELLFLAHLRSQPAMPSGEHLFVFLPSLFPRCWL